MYIEEKTANDGAFVLFFLPPGQRLDIDPNPFVTFQMGYGNSDQNALTIQQRDTMVNGPIWTSAPFEIEAGHLFNVLVRVSAKGRLRITIDGVTYRLPRDVVVPYEEIQLGLDGWQPQNRWHVHNFSVR